MGNTCKSCSDEGIELEDVAIKKQSMKELLDSEGIPEEYHGGFMSFVEQDLPGFLVTEAQFYAKCYKELKNRGTI